MKTNTNAALTEQVTQTARTALKRLVGRGLLPWPEAYTEEFWAVARSLEYSSILTRKGCENICPETMQNFLDETDKVLGGVKDTVKEFVATTKQHVGEMETSILSIEEKDLDNLFTKETAALMLKNRTLEAQAKDTEKRLQEQTEIIAELRSKLRIDALTGLLNRRAFENDLKKELAKIKRYKYPLSLVMVDIDHFKNINDSFGHRVGDKMLQKLAEVLKKGIRETDSAYRYGGEEFMIILPHTKGDEACRLAERLRNKIAVFRFLVKHPQTSIKITISIGVTQANQGEDVDEIINRVDSALYEAKNQGRNRTVKL